ncbi:hypothetical protein DFH09DRAFT_1336561 [Mycena vulgaris]|nr:hypothetical protein DFH09DRAFT_1336561 [Mycena vulgaris]
MRLPAASSPRSPSLTARPNSARLPLRTTPSIPPSLCPSTVALPPRAARPIPFSLRALPPPPSDSHPIRVLPPYSPPLLLPRPSFPSFPRSLSYILCSFPVPPTPPPSLRYPPSVSSSPAAQVARRDNLQLGGKGDEPPRGTTHGGIWMEHDATVSLDGTLDLAAGWIASSWRGRRARYTRKYSWDLGIKLSLGWIQNLFDCAAATLLISPMMDAEDEDEGRSAAVRIYLTLNLDDAVRCWARDRGAMFSHGKPRPRDARDLDPGNTDARWGSRDRRDLLGCEDPALDDARTRSFRVLSKLGQFPSV